TALPFEERREPRATVVARPPPRRRGVSAMRTPSPNGSSRPARRAQGGRSHRRVPPPPPSPPGRCPLPPLSLAPPLTRAPPPPPLHGPQDVDGASPAPANWVDQNGPHGAPGPADNAFVNFNNIPVTVPTSVSVNSLSDGATLHITGGATLSLANAAAGSQIGP